MVAGGGAEGGVGAKASLDLATVAWSVVRPDTALEVVVLGGGSGPEVGTGESFCRIRLATSAVLASACEYSFFCKGRLRLPSGVDLVEPYPPQIGRG